MRDVYVCAVYCVLRVVNDCVGVDVLDKNGLWSEK